MWLRRQAFFSCMLLKLCLLSLVSPILPTAALSNTFLCYRKEILFLKNTELSILYIVDSTEKLFTANVNVIL